MTRRDPVCHIPPAAPAVLPDLKNIPNIPPATDLKSALQAIAAMSLIIRTITGQNGKDGQNGFANNFTSDLHQPDWSEESRVTERVRVYQNNDKSTGNYVDIDRINQLTMANKKTKQRWQFNRKHK